VAPLRVAHDLSDRQRRILQAIAGGKESSFANIRTQINSSLADRTLRDDLLHLKRLGLIESRGHGRGLCGSLPQRQSPRTGTRIRGNKAADRNPVNELLTDSNCRAARARPFDQRICALHPQIRVRRGRSFRLQRFPSHWRKRATQAGFARCLLRWP
jgi:hypothetical protein